MNNDVFMSMMAAVQATKVELLLERDRYRALAADNVRQQGRMNAATPPVAPQQGALPQALPGAGGGLNQDQGHPVTPTNFDDASSPVNSEEAADAGPGTFPADDDNIVE